MADEAKWSKLNIILLESTSAFPEIAAKVVVLQLLCIIFARILHVQYLCKLWATYPAMSIVPTGTLLLVVDSAVKKKWTD